MKNKLFNALSVTVLAIVLWCFISINAFAANNETEDNNSFTNANDIFVNEDIKGNLVDAYDVDYYRFEATKAGALSVSFVHELKETNRDCWTITIFDYEGNSLLSFRSPGNKRTTNSSTLGIDKGIYYLQVKNPRDTSSAIDDSIYNFNILHEESEQWEKELNNTFSTANEIDVDIDNYGSITSNGENDYYLFNVEQDCYMSLWFTHPLVSESGNRIYWEATLYNYNGDKSISFDLKGNTVENVSDVFWVTKGL